MLKGLVEKFILFIALVLAISSFTGCGNEAGGAVDGLPQTNATSSPRTGSTKSSDFPPLVSKAADADMTHLDGTTSKITDKKGQVLLLNVWATWCGPCRSEVPELVKLKETFGNKGFEVIGLNADEDDTKEKIEEFSKEFGVNYSMVWAPTDMLFALFKVSKFDGIPQSFVIDRDGRLRGVFKGASASEIKRMEVTVAKVVNE